MPVLRGFAARIDQQVRDRFSQIRPGLRGWNRYSRALWIVIILSVVAQRLWIARNHMTPELLDDADHFYTSMLLYRTLARQGCVAFVEMFFTTVSHGFHPPLMAALTIPCYVLFGSSIAAGLWINVLFVTLFYVYLFKLARRLVGEWAALMTVIITALFPMTYGLARLYMLEFAMVPVVLMWLYYFERSEGFAKMRYLPGLGLLLGCGLLMKATFPLYIGGPIAWELFRKIRRGAPGAFRRALIRFLIMSGIGGLLALPWYLSNWSAPWAEALRHLTWNPDQTGARRSVFSWSTLPLLVDKFLKQGISVYFFVLGLVLLAILVVRRTRAPGRKIGFLLAWWIPPFLSIVFDIEMVSRYAYPSFPALAALLSLALAYVLPSPGLWRALVIGGLLLIPLGNFLQLSFFDVWQKLPERVVAGVPLGLLDTGTGYEFTYRPRRERWSPEPILETMLAHTSARPPQEMRGGVFPAWSTRSDPDPCEGFWCPISPSSIMFSAMIRDIPVMMSLFPCGSESTVECLKEQKDCEFLVVERPLWEWPDLERILDAGLAPYREIATLPMPKSLGTRVVVYQRIPEPTGGPRLER